MCYTASTLLSSNSQRKVYYWSLLPIKTTIVAISFLGPFMELLCYEMHLRKDPDDRKDDRRQRTSTRSPHTLEGVANSLSSMSVSSGALCQYHMFEARGKNLGTREPWMLRKCQTFSATPPIHVSFDTRRVRFTSVKTVDR